jgi:hypothetical protein
VIISCSLSSILIIRCGEIIADITVAIEAAVRTVFKKISSKVEVQLAAMRNEIHSLSCRLSKRSSISLYDLKQAFHRSRPDAAYILPSP